MSATHYEILCDGWSYGQVQGWQHCLDTLAVLREMQPMRMWSARRCQCV